jgi:hypothetical protein
VKIPVENLKKILFNDVKEPDPRPIERKLRDLN